MFRVFVSALILVALMIPSKAAYALEREKEGAEGLSFFLPVPAKAVQFVPEYCEGSLDQLCFGDYLKVLPKTAYVNKIVIPDTIIVHTDDQSGNTPQSWFSTRTYNGLAGRDNGGRSTHFGVGLDGIGQFLPMYEDGVIQCRGAGGYFDSHTVQIEMGGRTYNYMITGKASPEMVESIKTITAMTVELVAELMEVYDIPVENVMGHYEIEGSGKSDPGNLYFEEYFMPLLLAEIEK